VDHGMAAVFKAAIPKKGETSIAQFLLPVEGIIARNTH